MWALRRGRERIGNRERTAPLRAAGGTEAAERPAEHFLRRIAENGARRWIPDRDHAGLIGAYEAVAERHGDLSEASLLGAAEQATQIDLVDCHGHEIARNGDLPERAIEH